MAADRPEQDPARLVGELLARLPEHLQAPVRALSHQAVADRQDLLDELERYGRLIDAEANRRGDLDVELADEIMRAYRKLLLSDWGLLSEEERHLVQLSCRYYLDPGDDLGSVFGFDDDALVLNATLDLISRPGLKIIL